MQLALPTRDAADEFLQKYMQRELDDLDANDLLYQVNASRNYDPSAGLDKIGVPVMWINSADDFVNPPELGIAEREVKRLKKRPLRAPARLESDARTRHAHLGRGVAAISQGIARLLRTEGRRVGVAAARAPPIRAAIAPHGPLSRHRSRCINALRSLAEHGARMPARQIPRQMHRTEAHAHEPADDDAARRPPMPHLGGASRAHGDIEPMIESRAVLGVGLQYAHRLSLAILGRAKLLDQFIRERSAHAQHVIDGERMRAARHPVSPRSVVGQNFEAAVHRRHGLYGEPTARGARQLQMFGGARRRRLQIERLARRSVKQQHPRFMRISAHAGAPDGRRA